MDALLFEEIGRRRSTGERGPDLLSFLLDARTESGAGLADVDVRDELVTMLMAGHDTTEVSLTWAFGFILSQPRVVDRIRGEIHAVLAGRPLDVENLPRLSYLDAVIKESMRLGTVGPNLSFRRVSTPVTIGDYTLPAGVNVSNAVHLLHRRPDLYEQPLEFRPERFLGCKSDAYEWAPFGGGARRCIGMTFALWQMKIVLVTLLSRLDLSMVDPEIGSERSGFFIVPKRGLRVRAAVSARGQGL
jgi:cytochrome P450